MKLIRGMKQLDQLSPDEKLALTERDIVRMLGRPASVTEYPRYRSLQWSNKRLFGRYVSVNVKCSIDHQFQVVASRTNV
jgi:hypothetical protein